MTEPSRHYRAPGRLTHRVMNPLVALLTGAGLSVWGSRVLETTGRSSGLPRRTPVNLLEFEGQRYLVSPRGEGQWVRNVRAAGGHLTILLGRRREALVGVELTPEEKLPVLRAYLRKWRFETGAFFDGATATSRDEDLLPIARDRPVFRLSPAGA
jgi:deazaflavin-dependent oxidoreductase (nitroreductase family)